MPKSEPTKALAKPEKITAIEPINQELALSAKVADLAPFPLKGDYTLRDTDMQGLALRVSPGSKTWIVRRKLSGRSFRHVLGRYPDMTIATARRDAQVAMGTFAQGKHPLLEKKAKEAATKAQWSEHNFTVAKMWAQYTSQADPDKKLRRPFSVHTVRDFKRLEVRMETDPIWQMAFAELKASDVLTAYNRNSSSKSAKATNGGKTTGNLFFRMLGTAAQHHIDLNLKPETPNIFRTALRKKRNKSKARSRTITADPNSLKRWWDAVKALRASADVDDKRKRSAALLANYQLLVLLWGGRKSETLALKWMDIDFKRKVVIFRDTKNQEEHLFPLTPLAESIVLDLRNLHKKWELESEYVFAATRTGHKSKEKTHMKEPKTAMKKVAEAAQVPFSTHDIRRSFSNLLVSAEVGAELQYVKLALNHATAADVTTHNYIDKVRTLRPLYEKLEKAVMKKIGAESKPTVEVDATEYEQFLAFQAAQASTRRASRKTSQTHS